MHWSGNLLGILSVVAFDALVASTAEAASLQPTDNWKIDGLPSDVSMYVYVPDKVASNPPILTLIHYCGGTASAVFGQAQGGGIVSAADQYGFIMVVPSSGRCWDVESNKAWTRDGGGDSHAIKQMVTYAIGKYRANAERVYSTGDSSGGMMTELLLALYPDIFKAGSAFAGMPAGCRGANESGTSMGYSGACAGGNVTHTSLEWNDVVRKMAPSYMGHRPRVQLFHGDADRTINYKNFTEAIKEWSGVLGLPMAPTSTTMNVTLGMHQATRQQWNNACGYLALDGFTSIGGDHGPSDALFKAQFVIPFLGLDKTGAVDPEIAQCGSGGAAGSGGVGGGSGASGASGGGGVTGGSSANGGGVGASGASSGSGGVGGSGMGATGGVGGSSATVATGGDSGGGGTSPGGAGGTLGSAISGSASNGLAGAPLGTSGSSSESTARAPEGNGCICDVAGADAPRRAPLTLLVLLGGVVSAVARRAGRRIRRGATVTVCS